MKFVTDRPLADPDLTAHKLVEIANAIEAVQGGRLYIELINGPSCRLAARPTNTAPVLNARCPRAG
jgi:hypothetical protein